MSTSPRPHPTLEGVSFRPIDDDDLPFLRRLYRSTREEEMALTQWPEEEISRFLEQQFHAQHTFYQQQFQQAVFELILLDGEPAGRLYVDRREEEIRLIDIALAPETRNRGIGGQLLEDLIAEARGRGVPVRIHVERNNPALRLYRRLGFTDVEDQGVYFLMEWSPLGELGG
ncbi:MAG: GNAT family N-acetyltransferase [Acidobacteriota bacterium]